MCNYYTQLNKKLTKSELEISKLIAQGFGNLEICAKLFISERTLNTHLTNVYKKLEISGTKNSRLTLCLVVLKSGLVKLEDISLKEKIFGGKNVKDY